MIIRKAKRPKALWVQIRDAAGPEQPKARKRIRQVSKIQRARNAAYAVQRDAWLEERLRCDGCRRHASVVGPLELHHKRGRTGALLTDDRHWMAVCSRCHRWIHENPAAAAWRGWLAQRGEWGEAE